MARFQYDETGVAALYFFVCFFSVLLLPITYLLWPISKRKGDPAFSSKGKQPSQKSISLWKSVVLALGWSLLAFLIYRAVNIEVEFVEFDPFDILEIDRDASPAKIRRQYKRLSLKYHPDKEDGDPERFMLISKAHETLTNEDARRNWELYGNPDGPGAVSFGIALPSWIVEKENSFWFLMIYIVAIVVVLPVVVGCWWYNKIKFSRDDVLLDTQRMYWYYLGTSSLLTTKRLVMILGASFEFSRMTNKQIVERPDDDTTIPRLIKTLGNLNEKNRETVICFPHSLKARTLLHAHFSRSKLLTEGLKADLDLILLKCPPLIKELVNEASIQTLNYQGMDNKKGQKKNRSHKKEKRKREIKAPGVTAVENCMKLSQMVAQAVWYQAKMYHPLLMLPYVTETTVKHSSGRKYRIQTIKEFLALPDAKRRGLLEDALEDDLDENLTDEQHRSSVEERYDEVLRICGSYPDIHMEVKTKVLGEEESEYVTTKSLVTLNISLERKSCQDLISFEEEEEKREQTPEVEDAEKNHSKLRPWEKNKKKKGKKAKPVVKPKKTKPKKEAEKTDKNEQKNDTHVPEKNGSESESDSEEKEEKGKVPTRTKRLTRKRDPVQEDDSECSDGDKKESNAVKDSDSDADFSILDDEDRWVEMQKDIRRQEKVLVTKSTETHTCYAPRFPGEKHEWWWLYVVDEKKRWLQTFPKYIMTLKDKEEVEVQFAAPSEPGLYTFTVWLRSDCFIGFDHSVVHKVQVYKEDREEERPDGDSDDVSGEEGSDQERQDDDEESGTSFSEDEDD